MRYCSAHFFWFPLARFSFSSATRGRTCSSNRAVTKFWWWLFWNPGLGWLSLVECHAKLSAVKTESPLEDSLLWTVHKTHYCTYFISLLHTTAIVWDKCSHLDSSSKKTVRQIFLFTWNFTTQMHMLCTTHQTKLTGYDPKKRVSSSSKSMSSSNSLMSLLSDSLSALMFSTFSGWAYFCTYSNSNMSRHKQAIKPGSHLSLFLYIVQVLSVIRQRRRRLKDQ